MLEQQEGTTCCPAWLHEQPSGHCPPCSAGMTSVALGALGECRNCISITNMLQPSFRPLDYTVITTWAIVALSARLEGWACLQWEVPKAVTPVLCVCPLPFSLSRKLHSSPPLRHGSVPSPYYSSFMHYNAPDWSQEPCHILSAPFTHDCMLWESLTSALSPLGLSWRHSKCSVWGNLLPAASELQQALMMARVLEA